MKIDSYTKSPMGQRVVLLRTNANELTIIREMLSDAHRHIPRLKQTKNLRADIKNMLKAFEEVDMPKLVRECGASHRIE